MNNPNIKQTKLKTRIIQVSFVLVTLTFLILTGKTLTLAYYISKSESVMEEQQEKAQTLNVQTQ